MPLKLIPVPLTQKSDGVLLYKSKLIKLVFMHLFSKIKQKNAIKEATVKTIAEFCK